MAVFYNIFPPRLRLARNWLVDSVLQSPLYPA